MRPKVLNSDDKLATKRIAAVPTTQQQRDATLRFIEDLEQRGVLGDIDGWEGDRVAGYADILGLNNRKLDSSDHEARNDRMVSGHAF